MQRRKAWNANPPSSEAEARRRLLTVTQECIDRHGLSKVGLSDVAAAAGVTRQTVYRYFPTADELFNAAAVYASGGFLQRMRARVLRRETLAERIVETMVVAIREIPGDEHLGALVRAGDPFAISSALRSSFVQDEMAALNRGEPPFSESDRDELAELLLRLLVSFLDEPGPARSENELREALGRWLIPIIEDRQSGTTARSDQLSSKIGEG